MAVTHKQLTILTDSARDAVSLDHDYTLLATCEF
jgi:hypothetical protein